MVELGRDVMGISLVLFYIWQWNKNGCVFYMFFLCFLENGLSY